IAPARGATRRTNGAVPPRLLDAGSRLERDVLAAALVHPELRQALAQMSSDYFELELHRRFRGTLVNGGPGGEGLVALGGGLDALAERERIDERTGKELLLRLRERKLRRDLAETTMDLARATELQTQLAKVRQALDELA